MITPGIKQPESSGYTNEPDEDRKIEGQFPSQEEQKVGLRTEPVAPSEDKVYTTNPEAEPMASTVNPGTVSADQETVASRDPKDQEKALVDAANKKITGVEDAAALSNEIANLQQ